jgi:hypothetical protein
VCQGKVAQTMHTHVSKCKNNDIKGKKKEKQKKDNTILKSLER